MKTKLQLFLSSYEDSRKPDHGLVSTNGHLRPHSLDLSHLTSPVRRTVQNLIDQRVSLLALPYERPELFRPFLEETSHFVSELADVEEYGRRALSEARRDKIITLDFEGGIDSLPTLIICRSLCGPAFFFHVWKIQRDSELTPSEMRQHFTFLFDVRIW